MCQAHTKVIQCCFFKDDFTGDVYKLNDIAFTYAIFKGVKKIVDGYRNSEEHRQNQEKKIRNAIDKEMMVYDTVEKYKINSTIDEEQQVQRLLQILKYIGNGKNQIKPLSDDEKEFLFATIYSPPQLSVKIICEVYEKDFWTLWSQVKNDVNKEQGIEDDSEKIDSGELTTEELFKVTSEDRLYWWSEDGDVIISGETQNWLNQMSDRHKQLCSTVEMESGIMKWQKRLIFFLGDHNIDIHFFEDLYYEFLGNFHRPEYRAWMVLLESMSDDPDECNRLIAVLGNHALRKKYFG